MRLVIAIAFLLSACQADVQTNTTINNTEASDASEDEESQNEEVAEANLESFLGVKSSEFMLRPSEGTVDVHIYPLADWEGISGLRVYDVDATTGALTLLQECACASVGCPEAPKFCRIEAEPYRTLRLHVRAYSFNGKESELSPTSSYTEITTSDTTAPTMSGSVSASFNSSENAIDLSYDAATDSQYDASATIEYKVYRKEATTFADLTTPENDGVVVYTGTSLSASDTTAFSASSTYFYTHCATDASGNRTCATATDSLTTPATALTISSIKPDEIISTSGDYIVIKGTGFASGATVTIGGQTCTSPEVFSEHRIGCIAPATTSGSSNDVTVTLSGGANTTSEDAITSCTQNSCTNICNNPSSHGASFAAGTGADADNAYVVCTVTQANNIRTETQDYFELGANIDLDGETFAPLYTNSHGTNFTANLDGDNYAFVNHTHSGTSNVGVIGFFYGNSYYVRNLDVLGSDIDASSSYAGVVAGQLGSSAGCGSVATNIYVTGTVDVAGGSYAGGAFGYSRGFMQNITSAANVTGDNSYIGGVTGYQTGCGTDTSGLVWIGSTVTATTGVPSYVGGLVGRFNGGGMTLTSSYATGDVSSTGKAGGLFGYAEDMTMTGLYATGDVSANSSQSGGLVGYLYAGGTMTNSYATGDVDCGSSGSCGGLIGDIANAAWTISGSYATGNVSNGTTGIGGLIGRVSVGGGSFTNCYATGNVSASSHYVGGFIGYVVSTSATTTFTSNYATGTVTSSSGNAAGGFVGYSRFGTYLSSYSTGNVSGVSHIGGFCGQCESYAAESYKLSYATGSASSTSRAGGFIGTAQNFETSSSTIDITDCYATGNATTTGSYTGGFIGGMNSKTGFGMYITKSYATGDVDADNYGGGFVGVSSGTEPIKITQSYAAGDVSTDSANGSRAGGFVSTTYTGVWTIEDVYASGDVIGSQYVGGLIGRGDSDDSITDSYASGDVDRHDSSSTWVGGVVGDLNSMSASNLFWDSTVSGIVAGSDGTPESTSNMQTQATFTGAGWDFSGTWKMPSGGGYPILDWQ